MQSWDMQAREIHDKQQQHSAFSSREVRSRPVSQCESPPPSKPSSKQKNVNDESEGVKAVKYNRRVYHDIATVKESKEDNVLG